MAEPSHHTSSPKSTWIAPLPAELQTHLPGYEITRLLGQGGMGVVVQAQHIQLDERVALKFLTAEWATHPEAAERFLREARAAVRLTSEHVTRLIDVGELHDGTPYLVMEYIQGESLSALLREAYTKQRNHCVGVSFRPRPPRARGRPAGHRRRKLHLAAFRGIIGARRGHAEL